MDTLGINGRLRYLHLLTRFRINRGEANLAIRAALDALDFSTDERHAHTLHGVTATVGAEILRTKAKMLELAIKDRAGSKQIEPLLQTMTQELMHICATYDYDAATQLL